MSTATARAPRPEFDTSIPRLIADESGTLLYLNEAFETLCGVKAGGHTLSLIDLLHFENPDDAFAGPLVAGRSILKNLQSGAHAVYFERSKKAASLQFDWIEMPDARRVLVASVESVSLSVETVSRWLQRDTQNKALFSDGMFTALSRDALLVIDRTGIIRQANGVFCQWAGIRADAGSNFFDLIAQDQRAGVRTYLHDLTDENAAGETIQFECAVQDADGKHKVVEWTCRSEAGQCYALGRDITETRRYQNTLKRHDDQLREAEAIGRIGHWYWKIGQDDVEFSDELCRLFGFTPGDFTPTLDAVNDFVVRRDIGRMMRAFQRAIIEQNDHDIDFRIKRRDGQIVHMRCRGRCKLDAEGDVIALFGIMQDISDRVEHEEELLRAKDAAERAYAAKSQFLANMSHELRTPLNAIIGFSEILERQLFGPLGNDKYVGYTKGIRESGEHLLDLITDILDMSKIEAGQYRLELEKISIDKVLHTAIHMMEGRALDKRIKISLAIDREPRTITADKRALMQIILNILSNAVKFSHENGHVRIQCINKHDYLSIRVTDEGIGIPAGKMPYITRPFEQVSSQYNRTHEGSGLGLAITKELTELHGGALYIDSALGKGTSVTIRLPYKN